MVKKAKLGPFAEDAGKVHQLTATLYPAEYFKVSDRVGIIKAGCKASWGAVLKDFSSVRSHFKKAFIRILPGMIRQGGTHQARRFPGL